VLAAGIAVASVVLVLLVLGVVVYKMGQASTATPAPTAIPPPSSKRLAAEHEARDDTPPAGLPHDIVPAMISELKDPTATSTTAFNVGYDDVAANAMLATSGGAGSGYETPRDTPLSKVRMLSMETPGYYGAAAVAPTAPMAGTDDYDFPTAGAAQAMGLNFC
jgi:Na+-transporting methylmalonyl-CoA/oxaloacetate decarboxylase gamma subunit